MSTSFSLASEVRVFPCSNCRETINTTMHTCPFCHVAIDHAAAEEAAAATSRVSQACSDASYLKIMLGALIPFAVLAFFPIMGFIGLAGFVFLKYAVPVMTIRWWIKFGKLKTDDPDFSKARKSAILVSVVSFLVLVLLRVSLFGLRL